MKYIFTVLVAVLFTGNIQSQNSSNKASDLVDKMSAKIDSYKNMSIDFVYTLENLSDNSKDEEEGFIIIEGDKYRLSFMGNTFINDGTQVAVVSDEEEEVNFLESSDDEDSFSPSSMLKSYREGYSFELSGKKVLNNITVQYIKAIPKTDNETISYIMIGINAKNNELVSLDEYSKDDIKISFNLIKLVSDTDINEKQFIFDQSYYEQKNYTINK